MALRDVYTQSLDVNNKYTVYLDCMQNDDIILHLKIFDKSIKADLSGYNVRLKAFKRDQIPLIQNSKIHIDDNVITIEASKQLSTTSGIVKSELQFIDKSTLKKKSTFYIEINVTTDVLNVSDTISAPTCTLLEEIDNKLDQLDNIGNVLDEAIAVRDDLVTKIITGNTLNTNLDNTITSANNVKTNLDKSVESANNTKSNLDKSISNANNSKTNLDKSIENADKYKSTLEENIKQASEINNKLIENSNTIKDLNTSLENNISIAKSTGDWLNGKINESQELINKINEILGGDVFVDEEGNIFIDENGDTFATSTELGILDRINSIEQRVTVLENK